MTYHSTARTIFILCKQPTAHCITAERYCVHRFQWMEQVASTGENHLLCGEIKDATSVRRQDKRQLDNNSKIPHSGTNDSVKRTNHIRLGRKHEIFKTLQCHPLDWQLRLVILAAVILSLKQLMRKTKVSDLHLVLVINPVAHT